MLVSAAFTDHFVKNDVSCYSTIDSCLMDAQCRCIQRLRVNTTRPWMISSISCYHSRGLEYCSSGDIDTHQLSVYMTVGPRPAAGWVAAC